MVDIFMSTIFFFLRCGMWFRFKNWFMTKVVSMVMDYAELMGIFAWGVYGGGRIYSTSEYDNERDDVGDGLPDIGMWQTNLGSRLYKFVFRRHLNRWASDYNYLVVVMDTLKDSFSNCFRDVRVYGYYNKRLIYVVNRVWLEHGDFRFLGFLTFCFKYYWALLFYHISGGWAVSFRQLYFHLWNRFESRTYFARARFVNRLNRILVSDAGCHLNDFVLNRSASKLGRYGLFHFSLSCDDGIYYYWFFAGFFMVFCRLYDENDDLGPLRFRGCGSCYSKLDLVRCVRRFKNGDLGLAF